jgi:hypothetical protein
MCHHPCLSTPRLCPYRHRRHCQEIGNDFVSLDFIPKGVDTRPIVPALARVFDAALAGGGAKVPPEPYLGLYLGPYLSIRI